MTTPVKPTSTVGSSGRAHVQALLSGSISPHPSIHEEDRKRRAQLLSILVLIELVLTLIGGIAGPDPGVFVILSVFSIVAYIFSRTRWYFIGSYIFIYSIAGIGFFRIYQGSASSVETTIATFVHIALVLASALFTQGNFLLFVALVTVATFGIPLYSSVPPNFLDNVPRSGGIVLTLGMLLYGVDVFLSNLDRDRVKKLKSANLELENVKSNLEDRVAERMSELQSANLQMEERALRLQSISEISRHISEGSGGDLHELLMDVARSISEKTGYYHVGIFLLDENRQYAVLHAANSAGGMRMLDRRHQLKVGGAGIVGYVTQGGRPRIALDTGLDAIFFNNPDLPDTRSEMTLPLKVGAEIIGALDIQSTEPSAFNDEDVTSLSTLANQIAIIIQNSLFREGHSSLPADLQPARRGLLLQPRSRETGFSYLPDGTLSTTSLIDAAVREKILSSSELFLLEQPTKTGVPTLTMPVKFRDQLIGIIHIEAADNKRKWTEDEVLMVQAVSERAALALENANLFETAERGAAQERLISDVTSRIGESKDIDQILQTTIQELGRVLGSTRTYVQLGTTTSAEQE